jgi:hypothetical protein
MTFLISASLFTSAAFAFVCLIAPRMHAPGHVNFVLVVKQEPVKEERHEPPLWITLLIASAVGALGVWPWLIYFYLPVLVVVALAWHPYGLARSQDPDRKGQSVQAATRRITSKQKSNNNI